MAKAAEELIDAALESVRIASRIDDGEVPAV